MVASLRSLVEEAAHRAGAASEDLLEVVRRSLLGAAQATWPGQALEARWGEDAVELLVYRTVGLGEREVSPQACRDAGLGEVEEGDELGFQIFYLARDEGRRIAQAERYGDLLGIEQPRGGFGRIASRAAGRALQQAVEDRVAERRRAVYGPLVGQLVVGIVRTYERGCSWVDLGGVLARLPAARGGGKGLRPGDRVVARLDRVTPRGELELERSSVEFVLALLRHEVPEVEGGIVRIAAAAREAKLRTKIALEETPGVDVFDAVVGDRGARIRAVTEAIGGEQVDLVAWNADPIHAAIEALAGVDVVDVQVDEGALVVTVPESQLRAAVGRRGSNARLAAKLTGWGEVRIQAAESAA